MGDVARQVEEQVEAWTAELGWWLERVSPVFARPEPWVLLEQMTVGLLSPLRKKNGWTLAEQAGHAHPGRIQTFLCRGAWDGAALEEQVRQMVVESLGDAEDGVLIVDDTALVKKGTKSVGGRAAALRGDQPGGELPVRHEAPCCIPFRERRNSKEVPGLDGLPGTER